MNKKTFQEYFTEKSFKVFDHTAFGMENGYPITAKFIQNKLWSILLSVDIHDYKNALKEIKNEYGKKGRLSYAKGVLYLSLTVNGKNYDELYKTAVSDLIAILQRKGYKPVSICPICKQSDCDTVAAVPEYALTHKKCLDKTVTEVQTKAEKNDLNGNYILGFVGAILGAIVGILPSLLTVIWTETIYAILFALIPLCIYQGYKLFRGKMNNAAIVITVILSVIGVYLMQLLLIIYFMVAEEGYPVAYVLSTAGEWLFAKELWIAITQESISHFLFVAIGIYIAWTRISRTSATELKDAAAVYETAIPWNGGINVDSSYKSFAADTQVLSE